jgi:hypothetical protein
MTELPSLPTVTACPVVADASGEHNHSTLAATSSIEMNLPSGEGFARIARASSSDLPVARTTFAMADRSMGVPSM